MLLQKKVIKTKTSLLYTCAEDLHMSSQMLFVGKSELELTL